ncbi:hypothetical protein C0995_009082, partial [Termitomyces sp. Mi166
MAILAPPPQLAVVVVTTDPRTPEQYDGLIATQQKAAAASKSKGKVVPTLSDESDYGVGGGKVSGTALPAQYNKKLAAKKVRKAKAEAALPYTYGVVYLEQQFHSLTMSMDIFCEINDKRLQHLSHYSTPPAIPQWDGWREISEDNHYRLLFKHDEERALPDSLEAKGLYYYIGMDPNQ